MRSASPKTAKLRREAKPIRDAYLRAHRWCEVCEVVDPLTQANRSQSVHEPLTRARGGALDDEDNMVAVCGWHHLFIHANPKWATEHGWLRSSTPEEAHTDD